ncbi:hypothetical protein [Carnobacterium gallinarum]|nr:hypothetical protein [Carnobacterium gallinarum]
MIKNKETHTSEFVPLVKKFEANRSSLGIPDDTDYREFIVNEK